MTMIQCNDSMFVRNYDHNVLSLHKSDGLTFHSQLHADRHFEVLKKNFPMMKFELVDVKLQAPIVNKQ